MYLSKFEYFEPKTVQEACSLLSQYGEEAKILAGGTDLLVLMKEKEIRPKYLINIKTIPGLDKISYKDGDGLTLGCLCTLAEVGESRLVKEKFPILSQAALSIGAVQTRNMGTIGGNLCHASPSIDTAPPLLALGARVKLTGLNGDRILDLKDFFLGPNKTALNRDEILTEIQVPDRPPRSGGMFLKHTIRKAMDIAIVNAATEISLKSDGNVVDDIKIALGAVAPTPIRAFKAEDMLRGKELDDMLIGEAAEKASEETSPITDIRSSAEYRKEMVKVFTRRTVKGALNDALAR